LTALPGLLLAALSWLLLAALSRLLALLARLLLSAAALLSALATLLSALVLLAGLLIRVLVHNCSCVSSPSDNETAPIKFPPDVGTQAYIAAVEAARRSLEPIAIVRYCRAGTLYLQTRSPAGTFYASRVLLPRQ
jgi:hypothetical protein